MMNEVFTAVASQGAFAALFVYMLMYTMKKNDEREKRYQEIINNLTNKFESIEKGICVIQDDLKELKEEK